LIDKVSDVSVEYQLE